MLRPGFDGCSRSHTRALSRGLALSIGAIVLTCCGCGARLTESAAMGRDDAGASVGAGMAGVSAVGSKCGSTPRQLVDFNTLASKTNSFGIAAVQLAVDATNVYFVFGGALMRLPLRGGPATAMHSLATGVIQNNDPIVTSTAILLHGIVGTASDEQILRVPLDGGPATTLATVSGRVLGFTANESTVYFVDQGGVKSVPAAGGSVQTITDAIPGAGSIALVGANLIVTANSDSDPSAGGVFSEYLQGGTPTQLAAQQSAQFPMACGSDVCWWTGAPASAMGPTGPGFIARLENGSVVNISAPVFPWSLVFDGSNFFETVGCDVCSGTLMRIPASGAPATAMASAGFVAVDDECVYFSVAGGLSGIFSVAKSYADPALQPDQ